MQKIMKSTQDTFNVTNNAHKIKKGNNHLSDVYLHCQIK